MAPLHAGGADISCKLLQIGPSPTNTNLALVRGAVMVRRGPMVGLKMAYIEIRWGSNIRKTLNRARKGARTGFKKGINGF